MRDRGYSILRAVAIALEPIFAGWHIYMQQRIYRPLWDPEMRRRNPRGASLFYISLAHLPNNILYVTLLIAVKLPVWAIVGRIITRIIFILVINNYMDQYTGQSFVGRAKGWLIKNRKPGGE
jgi:hypothetical protein